MVERLIIYGSGESYTDLYSAYGLIINSKQAPAPKAKTRYIELPGSDVPADLSVGRYWGQRGFTLELTKIYTATPRAFIRGLVAALHGQVFRFAFLSAPTREFTGRFALEGYEVIGNTVTLSLKIYVHTAVTLETAPTWASEMTPSIRSEEVAEERESEKATAEQLYEQQHWLADITEELTLEVRTSQVLAGATPQMHVVHDRFDILQVHLPETIQKSGGIISAPSSYMVNIRSWFAGWLPTIELYRKTRTSDGKKFWYHRGEGYADGYWEALDGERHAHDPASSMVYHYPMTGRTDGGTTGLHGWAAENDGTFNTTEFGIVYAMCRINDTEREDAGTWSQEMGLGPLREDNRSGYASVFLDCSSHSGDQYYAYEGYVAMPYNIGQYGASGDWFLGLAFDDEGYEDYVIRLADLSMMDTLRTLRAPVKPGYSKGTFENPVLVSLDEADYLVLSNFHKRHLWPNYNNDAEYYPVAAGRMWYMEATDEMVYPRFEFIQATKISEGRIYHGQDAFDAGFLGVHNSIWDCKYVETPDTGTWLDNCQLTQINPNAAPSLYLAQGKHKAISYFHNYADGDGCYTQCDWTDAVYKVTGAYEKG